MTINPETEIVATAFDPVTRTHSYTVEKQGKRWTVAIPDIEFEKFGAVMGAQAATNKLRRRTYLANRLTAAMQGEPDGT